MFVRWFERLSLTIALLLPAANVLAQQSSPPANSRIAGELLIAPKQGVSEEDLERLYKGEGGKKIRVLSRIKVHRIQVSERALDAVEAVLRKNPNIEFVERNFVAGAGLVPNDPSYSNEWHLPQISAPGAWDLTTGASDIVIAVIDSGVDPTHPDLANKLVPGWNFLSNNSDTHDVLGHGTAVAGTVAAQGNDGFGVAGVAWKNRIMPLVVLNSSNAATYADIADAIIYAADHGAKVINISIGGSTSSATLQNAINYAWNKGLVIAASAMNYSSSAPYYPAAADNVLAVGATDQYDKLASFSDYGSWIDVVAPGVSIYTTQNGGGYWWVQGTSFASPQVVGLAALLFSRNPNLSNAQVVDLIRSNADDLGTAGFDSTFGWGRINAYRSLLASTTLPTTAVTITSPSDGSTVSGTVNVNVSATSTAGIAKVEFLVNGVVQDARTTAPFTFLWSTSGMNGSRSLTARAYDGASQVTNSAPESVTIVSQDTTPPTVQITSVSLSSKSLDVTASATDSQSAVTRVELYIDGVLKASDTSSPWSFRLNSKNISAGTHQLLVKARDSAGNIGVSSSFSVTK